MSAVVQPLANPSVFLHTDVPSTKTVGEPILGPGEMCVKHPPAGFGLNICKLFSPCPLVLIGTP